MALYLALKYSSYVALCIAMCWLARAKGLW